MKTKRPAVNSSAERKAAGKKPYNPPKVTRHPFVENREKRIMFRFGAVGLLLLIGFVMMQDVMFGGNHPRVRHSRIQNSCDRAINQTLDTVMWVHDQHQGKLTWAQLNDEVCKHMQVKRTEPWQRK